MIDINILDVQGFEPAIQGMRNPMNSWERSDSFHCNSVGCYFEECPQYKNDYCQNRFAEYVVGNNDLDLMQRLFKAGVEHRTYARMINVWMDINAPLYWWKEMDRYTVGKVQISTSTMHKIHDKPFVPSDFSHEHLDGWSMSILEHTINALNRYRFDYIQTKAKVDWYKMIQLLPSSYNQKRTVMISYETAMKIIRERQNHKLDEWIEFVEVLKGLPYMQEIMKDESSLETESEH